MLRQYNVDIPERISEVATKIDQCAEWTIEIVQWEADDGTPRAVTIRALTFKDRMLAERESTNSDGTVDAWKLVAHEVVAGMVRPRLGSIDALLDWNAAVVMHIHDQISRIGGLPAARLAAELARLAGGAPPDQPGTAPRQPDAHPLGVGGGAREAPRPAPSASGEPERCGDPE